MRIWNEKKWIGFALSFVVLVACAETAPSIDQASTESSKPVEAMAMAPERFDEIGQRMAQSINERASKPASEKRGSAALKGATWDGQTVTITMAAASAEGDRLLLEEPERVARELERGLFEPLERRFCKDSNFRLWLDAGGRVANLIEDSSGTERYRRLISEC